MAAGSDSQGLKIAVAAFVTLTVILAVATYFAYTSYSEATEKLVAAEAKTQAAVAEAAKADERLRSLKERSGYGKTEEFDTLMAEMKKDNDKLAEQLALLSGKLRQNIADYQSAGGDAAKVTELQLAADALVSQVTNLPEPNRTLLDTQNRLMQLMDNMAQLNTQVVLDNENLRNTLKTTDSANEAQLNVERDAVKTAKQDLSQEHDQNEQERQDLLRKYDELQTLTAQQATQIAGLKQQLAQMKDTTDRRRDELLAQLRQWRDQVERNEDVMDVPDGKILFVDNNRGEVRTDVKRSQGARERLQLAVFDRNSPGLPTDKPKGLIELIQVTDTGSVGRIVRTNNSSDPIRDYDLLYSAAWSENRPERFALVGKIDMDRDGRDDREDLKRMIEAAGGKIDYDLPPPGTGQEKGELSGNTSWYVTDNRLPLRPSGTAEKEELVDQDYMNKKSKAIEEARLNGVRPISIERLMAYLGYRFGAAEPGRAEAINRDAIRDLLNPRGRVAQPPAPASQPGEEEGTPAPGPAPAAAPAEAAPIGGGFAPN